MLPMRGPGYNAKGQFLRELRKLSQTGAEAWFRVIAWPAMGPWPLARFGAAAEWIGRRDALTFPLLGALNAELVRKTHVVVGCDLESIGLVTEVDATDPDAIERGARGM